MTNGVVAPAALRSLSQRNLHDQVVRSIGLKITRGDYEPGQSLPDEETLVQQLDVSRTVIREAAKTLAAKGLVESRPRRGTTVRPFEDWNMLDPDVLSWHEVSQPGIQFFRSLTEVRRVVEPSAASFAAERASDSQVGAIEDALAHMKATLGDVEAYMTADLRFHVAILTACRNPFLLPVSHAIGAVMMSSLMVTNRRPEMNRTSLPFHERIFEAIAARDAEASRRAMLIHLDDTLLRIERAFGKEKNTF